MHKVTIIPRGRALGVTQYLPEEDRVSYQRERDQGQARRAAWAAGRPSGSIYDDLSTGAAEDLKQATRLARDDGDPVGNERAGRPGLLPRL